MDCRVGSKKRSSNAFTGIDLIALLAILATATVIAIPCGGRTARKRSCSENLRQIGLATQLYAIDHGDRLPGCQHSLPSWIEGLKNYCSAADFVCPKESERALVLPLL